MSVSKELSSIEICKIEKALQELKCQDEDIETKLKLLNCPQCWDLDSVSLDKLENSVLERVNNKLSGEKFPQRSYFLQIVLAYFKYKENKFTESMSMLEQCKLLINEPDWQMKDEKKYFKHVVYSMLAWNHFKKGDDLSAIEVVLCEAKKCENNSNQSVFLFIEASFLLEVGPPGIDKALDIMRKLVKVSPEVPEYHFLIGKMLSRKRHFFYEFQNVSDEEEFHLYEANRKKPSDPIYALFLARTYKDLSSQSVYPQKAQFRNTSRALVKKILNQNHPNCGGSFISRCIFLLLSMPDKYSSNHYLIPYAEKAFELAPKNAMVNSYIGKLYINLGMRERALKHFSFSVKAITDDLAVVLLLKWRLNKEDNFIDFIENISLLYKFSENKSHVWYGAAQFFLIVKNDLANALKYFLKASMSLKQKIPQINISRSYHYVTLHSVFHNHLNELKSDDLQNDDIKKAKEVINKFKEIYPNRFYPDINVNILFNNLY